MLKSYGLLGEGGTDISIDMNALRAKNIIYKLNQMVLMRNLG